MTIIVGGNARGVGKTTLVCQLIAALPSLRWTAVKVSGHPHGQPLAALPPRGPQPKATDRFLAAGAAQALLLRGDGRAQLAELAATGRPLIIEANRAVQWVRFDIYLLLHDAAAPQPKPPERCHLHRAAWVLPPRLDAPESLLAALRLRLREY